MSLLAPDCKIRGKGRGHALELDVDEGDFAARRKAVGLAEFLAVHGLLRARRGWICGCSSAAASLYSPTAVCLQQVAAGLLGEPRVTTISIHASIAQPFFFESVSCLFVICAKGGRAGRSLRSPKTPLICD